MAIHVNQETGERGTCKAQSPESCPYSPKGWEHFANEAQMEETLETRLYSLESKSLTGGKGGIPEIAYESSSQTIARINATVREINNFTSSVQRGDSPDEVLEEFQKLYDRRQNSTRGALSSIGEFGDPNVGEVSNLVGFQAYSKVSGLRGEWHKDPFEIEAISHEISSVSLGETSIDEAKKIIEERVAGLGSTEEAEAELREIYKEQVRKSESSDKKLIFIDIETTGLNPMEGEIIEYGYTVTDAKGNILEKKNELLGVTDPGIHADEYNPTTVATKIDYSMIKGRPTFQESSNYEHLKDMLLDDNYIHVAHNAAFEASWWAFNIPGYFEKRHTSQKDTSGHSTMLDTRFQSKILDRSSKNSLEAFSEKNNIAYEGAHRALNDAEFMRKAFFRSRDREVYGKPTPEETY